MHFGTWADEGPEATTAAKLKAHLLVESRGVNEAYVVF
jgi:hypothetical protein